jgi:hypothetical protein
VLRDPNAALRELWRRGSRRIYQDEMRILADLLLEGLGSIVFVEPSSDRAIVVTFGAGSFGLLVADIWFLMTADPAGQLAWGYAMFVGSVLWGAAGLLVSILHLRRVPSDYFLSLPCLAVTLGAVMVPVAWLFTR